MPRTITMLQQTVITPLLGTRFLLVHCWGPHFAPRSSGGTVTPTVFVAETIWMGGFVPPYTSASSSSQISLSKPTHWPGSANSVQQMWTISSPQISWFRYHSSVMMIFSLSGDSVSRSSSNDDLGAQRNSSTVLFALSGTSSGQSSLCSHKMLPSSWRL